MTLRRLDVTEKVVACQHEPQKQVRSRMKQEGRTRVKCNEAKRLPLAFLFDESGRLDLAVSTSNDG